MTEAAYCGLKFKEEPDCGLKFKEEPDCGLKFKEEPDFIPSAVRQTKAAADYNGEFHYSRQGNGSLYRYAPRNVWEFYRSFHSDNKPKIHESVFKRIRGRRGYAPIGIPSNYELVRENGEIASSAENPYEAPAQAAMRAIAQDRIWDKVHLRVVVYYLTIFSYLHILIFPLLHDLRSDGEYSAFRPFSQFVVFVGSFLPAAITPWIRAYAENPRLTLFSILAVAGLSLAGPRLEAQIKDQMRAIWAGIDDSKKFDPLQYYFRSLFRTTFFIFGRLNQKIIIPVLTMTLVTIFCWVALAFVNGFLFSLRDANGAFCHRTERSALVVLTPEQERSIEFSLADFCKPTGILLEQDRKYLLSVHKIGIGAWRAGSLELNLGGFHVSDLPWLARISMSLLSVFKRTYQIPFFAIIARTGESEQFVDPEVNQGSNIVSFSKRFIPDRTGELFLYVNDTIGFPGIEDVFYKNNSGLAWVTIRRMD
jgi:hypothetical protein